jgi:hypothetical protein
MALVASDTPDRPNDGGLDYNRDGTPDTLREIAQEAVDWLAFAQVDRGPSEGGWWYRAVNNQGATADNSNSGIAVLGLVYAQSYPFGCIVPKWVRTELDVWIDAIQDPAEEGIEDENDGGSWYSLSYPANVKVNELKTGNLILQMAFVGDSPTTQRFQDALAFIERHWWNQDINVGWGYSDRGSIADYQAMYCLLQGLQYSDILYLDTDGDGERDNNWYNQDPPQSPAQDFATTLVAQQLPDGGWPYTCTVHGRTRTLCTSWALLILEQIRTKHIVYLPMVIMNDDDIWEP